MSEENTDVEFENIEPFLQEVESNRNKVGEASDSFLDGKVEIRLHIHDEFTDYRTGSVTFLIDSVVDLDQLAQDVGAYDVCEYLESETYEFESGELQDIQNSLIDIIEKYIGYNPYEPILDQANPKREKGFTLVLHDGFICYTD